MCLIVYKEDETGVFSNRQFKSMITRNRDGLGVMYREDDRVKFEKTVGTEHDKFDLFRRHRHRESYAMHARMKTHGLINEDNCHPYELLNKDKGDEIDLYMMHNGVLADVPMTNKDMSDTWNFVEHVLKPIVKADLSILWENDQFQEWLQSKIGSSKLLFMRSDDVEFPVLILNSDAGKTHSSCWLSNENCMPSRFSYNGGSYIEAQKGSGTTANSNFPQHNSRNGSAHTNTMNGMGGTTSTGRFHNDEQRYEKFWSDRQALIPPGKKEVETSNAPSLVKPNVPKLYLPRAGDSLRQMVALSNDLIIEKDLMDTLLSLKPLGMYELKLWAQDDPDLAADIILYCYNKCTLTYEIITAEINNRDTVDEIIKLLHHVVQTTYPLLDMSKASVG